MLLAACGGPKEEAEAPAKDTLVIAQGADAKSLDPHGTNDQPSSRVSAQIYDRLVETDLEMNVIPGLAESWEQPDALTTIFKLREGVKFHNGEELKASDVKFTIDRMVGSAKVHHIIQAVESVEVVDDYTVKIITEKPFGALLQHLSHTAASILNEKAVTEGGDNYGQTPVGTGPFAFVKWDAGDKIVLKANEDYFKGAPEMKNVIFRNVTEGTNRTIGLETKEIDIAYDIEPIDVAAIRGNDNLTLTEEPSLSMAYLGFNFDKEPFNNAKVREAISHAIKVDDIISAVLMGAGIEANSPIGPKVFGHNPDVKAPAYDVEKAKALLAEAGYADGFKTSIWTNDNPVRVQIAQIMQAQLKEIGIDMAIEIVEWGAYLDGTARGEHDMFILGWVSVTGDADYGLYAIFH
jgi:peptide/nickel transport system substrate-binding protein